MILQKTNMKTLKQPLMLFDLFFPPFFVIKYHLLWRCLGFDNSRKTRKAVSNFLLLLFTLGHILTQLVKISIVLLSSAALYQFIPVKELACPVSAFQVTLPTYAVGFSFARWKVTYGANCTT